MNTTDRAGGAEHSARMILDGFEALGTETHLAVGTKLTNDPRVIPLAASPHLDYRNSLRARKLAIAETRLRTEKWLGLEGFEHPHSRRVLELAGAKPDLILLINLHGNYFDLRVLPQLSRQAPVVARLCDSWLFTGHCACPPGCSRWETGCGACPDLSIPPAVIRDLTRMNWHRKRRILSASRLADDHSVTLAARARSASILAPAIKRLRSSPMASTLISSHPDHVTAHEGRSTWMPKLRSCCLSLTKAEPIRSRILRRCDRLCSCSDTVNVVPQASSNSWSWVERVRSRSSVQTCASVISHTVKGTSWSASIEPLISMFTPLQRRLSAIRPLRRAPAGYLRWWHVPAEFARSSNINVQVFTLRRDGPMSWPTLY